MGGGENHFRPKCENPSLTSPFLLSSVIVCLIPVIVFARVCVRQEEQKERTVDLIRSKISHIINLKTKTYGKMLLLFLAKTSSRGVLDVALLYLLPPRRQGTYSSS
mmetsp:Transcript_5908/g.8936  ORF Transcript_5908/g.8936 Transcript_5908/m.8936 type:complete len:106 (-) Transcript_5908:267-584(-)